MDKNIIIYYVDINIIYHYLLYIVQYTVNCFHLGYYVHDKIFLKRHKGEVKLKERKLEIQMKRKVLFVFDNRQLVFK